MQIAIDFDNTIVETDKPYDRVDGEFRFKMGAVDSLRSLKRAGHVLLLWSARASLHLRRDWRLNPLWNARPDMLDIRKAEASYELNDARFYEMVRFVQKQLPGIFDAIDEGQSGKPSVDLFIDDKCLQLGGAGATWYQIEQIYGDNEDVNTKQSQN